MINDVSINVGMNNVKSLLFKGGELFQSCLNRWAFPELPDKDRFISFANISLMFSEGCWFLSLFVFSDDNL